MIDWQAENGAEGVKKFKRNPGTFSAVLMDCEMPVMDGFRATRKIRQFEKLHELDPVPIIALTGNALLANKVKCLEAGRPSLTARHDRLPLQAGDPSHPKQTA